MPMFSIQPSAFLLEQTFCGDGAFLRRIFPRPRRRAGFGCAILEGRPRVALRADGSGRFAPGLPLISISLGGRGNSSDKPGIARRRPPESVAPSAPFERLHRPTMGMLQGPLP